MTKLPIFEAIVDSDELGIMAVSLVTSPATETEWICFKEDNKLEKFTVVSEDEHILSGVIMLCDTPIYRRNGDFEYYIKYSANTIKVMAEKMLADQTQNNIDIQHDGQLLDKGKVQLVELFIKNEAKGINPTYLSVPDGSLIGSYKIHDEDLWQMCKNGQLNGFSLAGYFDVEPTEEMFTKKYHKNTMNLKSILSRLMVKFTESTLEDGTVWIYDGELAEGTVVSLEDGTPVEDGEYTVEGKTITIKEGAVETIVEPETEEPKEEEVEAAKKKQCNEGEEPKEEEPKVEEPKEEEPAQPSDEPDVKAEVEAVKAEIETLKADIEALKQAISEIANTPAAEPVVEEYEKVTAVIDSKAGRMLSYLKD